MKCAVQRLPPIAVKEARHEPVAVAAVPDENTAGSQHARKLREHEAIVGRVREEAKGREQIEHRVEPSAPGGWKAAHVALMVAQRGARPSLARTRKELW